MPFDAWTPTEIIADAWTAYDRPRFTGEALDLAREAIRRLRGERNKE